MNQGFPKESISYRYRCVKRFITGIASCTCEVPEVPHPAPCNQRQWSQKNNLLESLMAWKPGAPMDEDRSKKQNKKSCFLCLFVLFGSLKDWWILTKLLNSSQCSPALLRIVIQMLISSRNSLTDTSRNVLPALWASFNPIKLSHII